MSGRRRNLRVPVEGDGFEGESTGGVEILADSRRQYLISELRERESCQLTELAQRIAREEIEGGSRSVSSDQIRAVYLDLRRNHLPALVDAGLVGYADDVGRVTLRADEATLTGNSDGNDGSNGQ